MRKFFAVALGSVVALAGFAGSANASATIDLVWITTGGGCFNMSRRDCPQLGSELSNLAISSGGTVAVILTAGPLGSLGGGVSVDYRQAASGYDVSNFRSFTTDTIGTAAEGTKDYWLPLNVGTTADDFAGSVENINSAATGTAIGAGLGMPAGGSVYLGTVSFHKKAIVNGTFELPGFIGASDGIVNLLGGDANPTFHNAYLINVPEPGALSLLVMGVGGMLLAGRGRRS
jgi:hypothetical protein